MENIQTSEIFDKNQSSSFQQDQESMGSDICSFDEINSKIYRLGCCKPQHIKILKDVILLGGNFYYTMKSSITFHSMNKSAEELPVIKTSFQGKELRFRLRVSNNRAIVPCRKIFNGTLHVIDRATMHNMFHICEYNLCFFTKK